MSQKLEVTPSDLYLLSQLAKFMVSECPKKVLDEFLKGNSTTMYELSGIQDKLREAAKWKSQNQSR